VINSVGNIGGFAGPYIVGAARETTGNFSAGLWVMAGCLAVGVVIAMTLARQERQSALMR
jgi:ACS family tartrate transporter-like MFS transporter